jgi:hypothetical protein
MNVQGPAGPAGGHPEALGEAHGRQLEEAALQASAASLAAGQRSFVAALQAMMAAADAGKGKQPGTGR